MRDPTFVLCLEGKHLLSGLDIPKCERSQPVAGENPAIAEHDEARNPPVEAFVSGQFLVCFQVPQSNGSILRRGKHVQSIEHSDARNTARVATEVAELFAALDIPDFDFTKSCRRHDQATAVECRKAESPEANSLELAQLARRLPIPKPQHPKVGSARQEAAAIKDGQAHDRSPGILAVHELWRSFRLLEVPEPQRFIRKAGNELVVVNRTARCSPLKAYDCHQPFWSAHVLAYVVGHEPAQLVSCLCIPETDGIVLGGRDDATIEHRQPRHRAIVADDAAQLLSSLGTPDSQCLVLGAGCDARAVNLHETQHWSLMPFEAAQLRAGLGIPHPDRLVV